MLEGIPGFYIMNWKTNPPQSDSSQAIDETFQNVFFLNIHLFSVYA